MCAKGKSEAIDQLVPALVSARAAMKLVGKGGSNQYDGYTYAQLSDYHKAIGAALQDNGLHVVDHIVSVDYDEVGTQKGGSQTRAKILLETTILHASGQWLSIQSAGEGRDRSDKAVYKATTGARKYAIAMLLSLATTDDPEVDSLPGGEPSPQQQAAPPSAQASEPSRPVRTGPGTVANQQATLPEEGERSFEVAAVEVGKQTDKYTLLIIKTADGFKFSTFNQSHADIARDCQARKVPAAIRWSTNRFGRAVEDLSIAVDRAAAGEAEFAGIVLGVDCEQRTINGKAVDVYYLRTSHGDFATVDPKLASEFEHAKETEAQAVWFAVEQPGGGRRATRIEFKKEMQA